MLHLFNKLLPQRGAEPSQEVQESGKSGFTQASRASPGPLQPAITSDLSLRGLRHLGPAAKRTLHRSSCPARTFLGASSRTYSSVCATPVSTRAWRAPIQPKAVGEKPKKKRLGSSKLRPHNHHSAISSSGISDTLVTNTMSPVKTCVVLTSSMVSITEQKYEIGHLKQLLDGNKIKYTEVDCSLEENRDTRNRYFEASGIRANYPQVFLQDPEGTDIQYVGSFKEIQELNEVNDVSPEILKANNIPTLNSVFADVARRA
ncbi:hypothetical protein PC118_g21202 [Phytophthora cactorum]|uniref:Thioredoxin-like fold n=3 Tax=Phytophthora cactorum TaxID=29920 RepID=A0A8T0ZDV6_9STRA|nr:hypothetical protein PC111_g6681 [Phytophthora cactorum]KAG2860473.1 hypothetical protein PC113_g8024 [Phytophthora cactorum]KAG2889776.1 hypothetical protein PC115_g19657 [Phytophthora cactorum]KAG2962859.1 hypothetical protein PC118_g21202 [Phytophthora cactorum]KAG2972249.1 hypothetical protein PC119_g23219 [Phytophthora cactorum]